MPTTTATNNIEVLANKIYDEGIAKANLESEKILSKAKEEAASILAQAEEKSEKLIEAAKQEANKTKETTKVELQLVGQRFINDLRLKVSKLLVAEILGNKQNKSSDPEFITTAILEIIQKWQPEAITEITIDKALEKRLKDEIGKVIPEYMTKVKLSAPGATNQTLTVIKTAQGYEFQFGKDSFNQFLHPYFSTFVKEIIFNEDD